MHYVIGDVHGCYEEMTELLRQIEEDDKDAIVYFVGDLIDRGPKVWETLMWAMNHITLDGKYRCVRGNHEAMVLEWYEQWIKWKEYCKYVPNPSTEPKTLYGFDDMFADKGKLHEKELELVMDFFRSMPYHRLVTVTDTNGKKINYRIVHAWYCYEENVPKEWQQFINLYDREQTSIPVGETVVHGHTPTVPLSTEDKEYLRPGKIGYEENGINVDGGCCYHCVLPELPFSLCGICLETRKEYYCEPIIKEIT